METPDNNNHKNGVGHRVAFSLLPVAATVFFGQGFYLVTWGFKIDSTVAENRAMIIELRTKLDRIDSTASHNATRGTSLEEMVNSTQSRLDTLIALLQHQRREDRREDDKRYRLQSEAEDTTATPRRNE